MRRKTNKWNHTKLKTCGVADGTVGIERSGNRATCKRRCLSGLPAVGKTLESSDAGEQCKREFAREEQLHDVNDMSQVLCACAQDYTVHARAASQLLWEHDIMDSWRGLKSQ